MRTLTGVHVVSMALNVPGPLAAARLCETGASVIKVEPPSGDPLEDLCPEWYVELHRDLSVQRLDLKSRDGQERMRDVLSQAQLFLTSQRPSALARLHVDPQSLATDPRTAHLRVLNIVGDIAQPEAAGHDLTYVARAGLLGPELPRTLVADVTGSERAFSAALLLLGQPVGSHAQVGLLNSLESLVAPLRYGLTRPGDVLGGGLPSYGLYDTREGQIAVAALEPRFRERLYAALERPLNSALGNAFLNRTADEWEAWGREHDVPISAIARG